MPVTTDELIAFLTRLRGGAIEGVRQQPDGPEGGFRQQALDLINSDLRTARASQKLERENRWKRRKPVSRTANP